MIKDLGQVAAIYIGTTEPVNYTLLWLDTNTNPGVYKAYDSNLKQWVPLATQSWVQDLIDNWIQNWPVSDDIVEGDYILINKGGENYKIEAQDVIRNLIGKPLNFQNIVSNGSQLPASASDLKNGDLYILNVPGDIDTQVVTQPTQQVFPNRSILFWDEREWKSMGRVEWKCDLSMVQTSDTVTINSSLGTGITIPTATDSQAGVLSAILFTYLTKLSNGTVIPRTPNGSTQTPGHIHNYTDIEGRIIVIDTVGDINKDLDTSNPPSQRAVTEALYTKYDKTGGEISGIVRITDGTEATQLGEGALIVNGGLSIFKNVYFGENLDVVGATHLHSTLDVDGITHILNTTDSTANNNGALVVDGGVGIAKNVNIGGAVDIDGNSSLHGTLTVDGATTLSSTLHTVDAVTFDNTLDVAGISNFNNTTDSTAYTNGAVVVDGGVGIAKRLNVHGATDIDSTLNVDGVTTISNTIDSTSTSTGALVVKGGVGIAKQLRVGGATTLSSTLTVAGITNVTNTTDSTSTATGAIHTAGGVGIAKQLRVGGNTNLGGTLTVAGDTVLNSDLTVNGNTEVQDITIHGNVTQEGQSFITKAETVEVKDNILLLNRGETAAGVSKGLSGIEVDRGTSPNFQFVFDESDDYFKAGEVGDLQILLLRDADANLTNNKFFYWDNTNKIAKTREMLIADISDLGSTWDSYLKAGVYNRNITVNGTSYPVMTNVSGATAINIYAPTTAGTSGQFLKSTGGTPSWNSITVADISNLNSTWDSFMTGSNLATRDILINGSAWTVYSSVGTDTTRIYAPTTMSTNSNQVLIGSSDNIPKWGYPNLVSVQDVRDLDNQNPTPDGVTGRIARFYFTNQSLPSVTGMGQWISKLTVAGWDAGYNVWELAGGSTITLCENLVFRAGINDTWGDWHTIAFQDWTNTQLAKYLPLSGGTMTGDITMSSNTRIKLNPTNASIATIDDLVLLAQQSNGATQLGNNGNSTVISSNNSDLTHVRGTVSSTIYDSGNTSTRNLSFNGTTYPVMTTTSSPSTITWYAPRTAGTQYQVLRSNGSGAPVWSYIYDVISSAYIPLATYKYDATNSIRSVWNKIGTLLAGKMGTKQAQIKIRALEDNNYPSYSEWILAWTVYNLNGTTTPSSRNLYLAPTTYNSNHLYVGIDEDFNIWVRSDVEWDCHLQFILEYASSGSTGVIVFTSDIETIDPATQAVPTFIYEATDICKARGTGDNALTDFATNGYQYLPKTRIQGTLTTTEEAFFTGNYIKISDSTEIRIPNSTDASSGITSDATGGTYFWFPANNQLVVGNSNATGVTLRTNGAHNLYHQVGSGTKHKIFDENNLGTITFTGAVSATYNGQSNITVNIPQGGGGTADSVAWENVTGKPSWIGSSKPTYSYSEISGTVPISDIPTGTSSSTVALGNHTHNTLYAVDDRDIQPSATGLSGPKAIRPYFRNCDDVISGYGTYADFLYFDTYSGDSGGRVNGLAMCKNSMRILHYQGVWNGSWTTVKPLAYLDDIPDTVSISISGGGVTSNQYVSGLSYSNGVISVSKGTLPTVTLNSLGITATAAEINKLDGLTATTTELNYVDGVTSNIQTQLNGKAASTHTHTVAQINNLGTNWSARLTAAINVKSVNINGTATSYLNTTNATAVTIYAPTSAGTDGYLLVSNGSGAPSWASVSSVIGTGFVTIDTAQTITGAKTFTAYTIFSNGAGTATSSDKRLKENIKEITYNKGFDEISLYSYNFKGRKEEKIGLIAQEVQKVIPQAVIKDEKGYLAIDTYPIVATLVAANKERVKEVKDLKSEIDNLKQEIEMLKQEISILKRIVRL